MLGRPERFSGTVTMRLFKGSANVVGRESAHALYDERFVTFGEDDVYQQSDAAGFIRLYGLANRVRALKDMESGANGGGNHAKHDGETGGNSVAAPVIPEPEPEESAEPALVPA